jgi:homoserine dehydrogenase
MKPVTVGLLGLGTVGSGLVRLLERNRAEYARRLGREIVVTHAYTRDGQKKRDCNLSGVTLVADPMALAREAPVDIVVELLGGISPARELILAAIGRGKPVVTANKALLAEQGDDLFKAARDKGVGLAFEASVAGGIPIIRVLREGLAGNRIDGLAGIINGTCNYILTQMTQRQVDFATALAEAQSLGYAEADPGFDVDGNDAAHKLTILASLAFGIPLSAAAVSLAGIRGVTARDIQLAGELGYRIKSLGIAKNAKGRVELRVQPTLVPQEHLLAKVDGVLNAVIVQGDAVGETGYYGRGAGGDATASSVVSDLLEIAREMGAGQEFHAHPLGFNPSAVSPAVIVPAAEVESAHYVCLRVADTPGVLKGITSILAELDISIEAILQKEPKGKDDATVAIITSVVSQARFDAALAKLLALKFVRPGSTNLRVEHFNGR